MNSMVIPVLLVFVFLMMSAFFSGMEAALFSLSRFRVKALVAEERRGARALAELKREPGITLASILLANLLVNIGASSIAAIILVRLIELYQLESTLSFIIEFFIMTSLLLLIGEITPKTIALLHAERVSLRFSRLVLDVVVFLRPVARLVEVFSKRIISQRTPDNDISDKDIELMLREAKAYRILDKGEEDFGRQILKFSRTDASEIMTPRNKVIGIKTTATIERARKRIINKKHSRICVYDKQGNVAGILYAKDLFLPPLRDKDRSEGTVMSLMRDPYIVPETKHIHNLLGEFRKLGIHIAVIVDEFGNFSGIVTLEDILEFLYGEIVDEYDERDELADIPYQKVDATTYIFKGDISIGELARILAVEPFDDEGERLAGFLYKHFGRVPKEEESVVVDHLEITIIEMYDRIIEKVRVRRE